MPERRHRHRHRPTPAAAGAQLRLRTPDGPTTIEGVLERLVFANQENGWSVVRLAVADRREPVTAVGSLPGVQPGESLRLSGSWIDDPRWGRQFKIESFVSVQPSTLVGIERYLGSGLVEGIGKVMAKRLVQHFGLDTLHVIDQESERLAEVEGIGPVRSSRIREAWAEQRRIRTVMVFLQGHGVSTAHAVKIYRKYGDQAVAIVRDNPYRLAIDIAGIGFRTADQIAAQLGVARSSPRRAEAGVLHALATAAEEGHVYVPRGELARRTAELLEVDAPIVEAAIDAVRHEGHVVIEKIAGPQAGQAVFLGALHAAETRLAAQLRTLVATPVDRVRIDVERAIEWFEVKRRLTLAPAQREAVRRAITRKVLLVTGGPGTGKTTIVNALLGIVTRKGRRVLLCAPTGRAAKRLAETTGHPARTIHRLLEFSPRAMRFERNRHHPLEADLVVIDELSMVDVMLAAHLVEAIPARAQVVLVGDPDQLPSVGPGCVLRDLLASGAIDVVRLTEIFRQARRSLIVRNAHRINRGEMPLCDPLAPAGDDGAAAVDGGDPPPGDIQDDAPPADTQDDAPPADARDDVSLGHTQDDTPAGDDAPPGDGAPPDDAPLDFYFIERDDPAHAVETIKHLVTRRIPGRFGLDPVADIQVLTPMHRGLLGAAHLNGELQTLLTPPGPSLTRGAISLRVGDKVMQTRNNYDLDVYNGDIGRVLAVDTEDHELVVDMDGRRVRYARADLDDLVLAFACSIHKAQGSEYPAVVMPIHTQHYVMLQRNLLYTGITRGRRLVVIIGTRQALAMAVRNAEVAERWTRLAARLAPDRPVAG